MATDSYDVFISYHSSDIKYAEELNEKLVAQKFRVWFDKTRLKPGSNWHAEIEKGCEASRIVLPVLTPKWQKSEWTKFETYGAEAVIPIHYEGDRKEITPPPITRYQNFTIDVTDPKKTDWSKLYKSIRSLLNKPVPQK